MSDDVVLKQRVVFLRWLDWHNDDKRKTIIVAMLMSLICSFLVAGFAVMLKPQQQANKRLEIQRNILAVAGIHDESVPQAKLFEDHIETRLVNIDTGSYLQSEHPERYDWRAALRDSANSDPIAPQTDIAKIKRRLHVLPVYLVKQGDTVKRVIVPVYGYGLWSTLYGFLALEADGKTVAGIRFYEHAETPGLGGEVDNPKWRQLWEGKLAYDDAGAVKLEVVRGQVRDDDVAAKFKVDGLSGATLTSQGVSNLVRYWLGPEGFALFLQRFKAGLL